MSIMNSSPRSRKRKSLSVCIFGSLVPKVYNYFSHRKMVILLCKAKESESKIKLRTVHQNVDKEDLHCI